MYKCVLTISNMWANCQPSPWRKIKYRSFGNDAAHFVLIKMWTFTLLYVYHIFHVCPYSRRHDGELSTEYVAQEKISQFSKYCCSFHYHKNANVYMCVRALANMWANCQLSPWRNTKHRNAAAQFVLIRMRTCTSLYVCHRFHKAHDHNGTNLLSLLWPWIHAKQVVKSILISRLTVLAGVARVATAQLLLGRDWQTKNPLLPNTQSDEYLYTCTLTDHRMIFGGSERMMGAVASVQCAQI